MSLPVIVTRAEPGASETMARLAAMDVTPIASPMLSLARLKADLPDLSAVQHLVFTSANGVRFFTEASTLRAAKAWCVGPSTAAAALIHLLLRVARHVVFAALVFRLQRGRQRPLSH